MHSVLRAVHRQAPRASWDISLLATLLFCPSHFQTYYFLALLHPPFLTQHFHLNFHFLYSSGPGPVLASIPDG